MSESALATLAVLVVVVLTLAAYVAFDYLVSHYPECDEEICEPVQR